MSSRTVSLRIVIAGVVVALAGTFALTAFAHGGPGGRHGASMMGMFGGHMSERVLDHVNATPEQRSQIKQITQAAASDLKAQRESGRAVRERAMELFAQPTIDANAAEALRQQMLARHDEASKRMTQAMIEVSRVLSPEQRRQLVERMQQRHEQMQRHWRERQSLEGQPGR